MNNKSITFILVFAAGVIIGAVLVYLINSCSCRQESSHQQSHLVFTDTTEIHKVSATTANDYFKAYFLQPASVDSIKGFSISSAQFTAMKMIAESDSTVHGFRIYMGLNGNMPVRIVVGTGSPDRVESIYTTTDENCGLCPDICDDSSPIIEE
jgi:hypothetical protein